jgi:N-acetylglucosamine-6-phosphate deacetylase
VIGMHDRKGHIAVGRDADLIGLDDALTIQWTMVGGELLT